MPNNIVLADAQATPVNHTFVCIEDGATARYINETGALTLSGQETLVVEVIRPKTDAAQSNNRVVIWDPVEGTVDGKTSVLYGNSSAVNFKFAPNATLQEKKDIVKMTANALLNADVVSAVTTGRPIM